MGRIPKKRQKLALKKTFKSKEVVRLTGIPHQTLHHWAKSGFLKPSVQDAKGTGTARLYSFQDLLALRVARKLRDFGLSLRELRKIVDHLRSVENVENPLAETFLVVHGDDIIVERASKAFSVLKRPGQGYLGLCLNLSHEVQGIKDDLLERTTG